MRRSAEKSSHLTRAQGSRRSHPLPDAGQAVLAMGMAPISVAHGPLAAERQRWRCARSMSKTGRRLLARPPGLIDPTKGVEPRAMPAKARSPLTPMLDQARSQVHQLLPHRADAPALRLMTHRGVRADEAGQPNVTQDVVDQGRHRQDQVIGRELSRGQPLEVEIGLEFGRELLARGMRFVQPDDFGIGELQGSPPAFDVHLGDPQPWASRVRSVTRITRRKV